MIKKSAPLNVLRSWLGVCEPDHAFIIDIYNHFFDVNGHRPRGYRVTYHDAWCATGLSAAIIEAGGGFDYPLECGCQEMINLYEALGQYHADKSFEPEEGDIVFYDWQRDGHADHVGMVEVNANGILTVIECNNDDAVKRRDISANSVYIKGYARPNWENEDVQPQPEIIPDIQTDDGVAVYRLYNAGRGVHFYTASHDEAQNCVNVGWVYEGLAWIAPKDGKGVFRFVKGDTHAFTITEKGKQMFVAHGYAEEGQAFLGYDTAAIPCMPVYCVYNPNSDDFVYTLLATEYDALSAAGWHGYGIAFYAVR